MEFMKRFNSIKSIENESIRKILFVSFALIFTIPLLIFFFIVDHYNLLRENLIQLSIAGYLLFAILGLILIRKIIDEIMSFSKKAKKITQDTSGKDIPDEQNELKIIANTFQTLVEKLEENTSALGKRIFELSSLHKLTVLTSKISDFSELLGLVLEKLVATTESLYGMILSVPGEGENLKIEATRGIKNTLIPGEEIYVNKTIAGRVLKENEVIVCADPANEPGFNPQFDNIFEGGPFLAKAIKARGIIIAILILSRGENGELFKDNELDYITTALGHISFALNNAQLIRELQDSYDELKEMQQKLINLERVEAINQTVVTLNDKINNPLTVIRGHVELIRKNLSIDDEKLDHSLQLIEESVHKCVGIMQKLRKIREPAIKYYAGTDTTMIDIDRSINDNNKEENEEK